MRKETLRKAAAAVMAASMVASPVTAMATDVDASGLELKLTAGVDGDEEQVAQIAQILSSSFISFAGGETEDGGAVNITANMMGQDLFKAVLGTVGDKLGLSLPGIDENMYTISLDKVEELVNEMVSGNSSLANLGSFSAPDIDPEKVETLLEKYMEPIATAVSENMGAEEGPVVLTHIGKEVDGVNATWVPTGDDVAALLETYADMIEDDADLEEVIGVYVDYAEQLQEQGVAQFSTSMQEFDPDAVEGLDEEEAVSEEGIEALRNFRTTAPEAMRKTAESFKGQYTDGALKLTMGLAGDEQDLAKIELVSNMQEADEEEVIFCFENDENKEFNFAAGTVAETFGFDFKIDKAENGEYAGAFSVLAAGQALAEGTYDWNTNETSRLAIPAGNVTLNVMGMISADLTVVPNAAGDEHTLTVSGIDAFTNGMVKSAFLKLTSLDLTEAITLPEGTEVDVTDYSQEQLSELGQTLVGEIGSYVQSIFG